MNTIKQQILYMLTFGNFTRIKYNNKLFLNLMNFSNKCIKYDNLEFTYGDVTNANSSIVSKTSSSVIFDVRVLP